MATYKITKIHLDECNCGFLDAEAEGYQPYDCVPSSMEVEIPSSIARLDRKGDGRVQQVFDALLDEVNASLDLPADDFTAKKIR